AGAGALAAAAGASAATASGTAGAQAGLLTVVLSAPLNFAIGLTAILQVHHYALTTPYDVAAYPHSGYPDVASYLLSDAVAGNIIGLVLYPIPLLALALLGAAAGTGLHRRGGRPTARPPPPPAPPVTRRRRPPSAVRRPAARRSGPGRVGQSCRSSPAGGCRWRRPPAAGRPSRTSPGGPGPVRAPRAQRAACAAAFPCARTARRSPRPPRPARGWPCRRRSPTRPPSCRPG